MKDEEEVRITVTVSQETADRIETLADRMNASHSKMASWLLEAALDNETWIIKIVTSRVVKGLRAALTKKKGRKSLKVNNKL